MTTAGTTVDRSESPVVDHHTDEPLLKRLGSLQSVWILGVLLIIVVFFTITGGSKFLSASNFSLISHSMPHVLEVANRIHVMRLGTRIATMPAEGTTVEELVGAMTGALDAKADADKEVAQ